MRTLKTLVLLLFTAAGLSAQGAADVRASQLKKLELERKTLLAMADSMPESLFRDKATPEQRDFAQQLHHAAGATAMVVGRCPVHSSKSLQILLVAKPALESKLPEARKHFVFWRISRGQPLLLH